MTSAKKQISQLTTSRKGDMDLNHPAQESPDWSRGPSLPEDEWKCQRKTADGRCLVCLEEDVACTSAIEPPHFSIFPHMPLLLRKTMGSHAPRQSLPVPPIPFPEFPHGPVLGVESTVSASEVTTPLIDGDVNDHAQTSGSPSAAALVIQLQQFREDLVSSAQAKITLRNDVLRSMGTGSISLGLLRRYSMQKNSHDSLQQRMETLEQAFKSLKSQID
ncbi:hypothetical protein BXZ70DRAFT_911664 [Cristinia sonorae]|uniref:Uncharacterized protein n=1 Tax=Cristinia sonorae TaxID=1940300 RepID=A0A8K0UD82_9AGAR|nr:hypothetical protein BXZ70DRAFT_911664 [Cristinia sonorae]